MRILLFSLPFIFKHPVQICANVKIAPWRDTQLHSYAIPKINILHKHAAAADLLRNWVAARRRNNPVMSIVDKCSVYDFEEFESQFS